MPRITTRSGRELRRFAPYPTRSRSLAPVQGSRNTGSQQRVIGIEDAIDPAQGENLAALGQSSIMATGLNVSGSGGWIRYGAITNGQRSTVTALVTPSMIRQGSTPNYDFPFFNRRFGLVIVRGHLLARVLGGDGAEPRNLVPLPHAANNLPMYEDLESRVQRHVEKGNTAKVSVRVIYGNGAPGSAASLLPTRLIYRAKDGLTGRRLLSRDEISIPIRF